MNLRVHCLLLVALASALACATGPKPEVVLGRAGTAAAFRRESLHLARGESESSRYRIVHALFGEIGELTIRIRSDVRTGTTTELWAARAAGSGSVLGFGHREQIVFTEFDPLRGLTARFTSYRHLPDREFTDVATQATPGQVAILRKRPGKPPEAANFADRQPVFDPLALLLFVRATPPREERTIPMLDGQAFAQVTLTPRAVIESVTLAGESFKTRAWDAIARPFTWQHQPNPKQSAHRFTLWVSDDERRLPVLLEADSPLGQVRIELLSTQRKQGAPQLAAQAARNSVLR